MTTTKTQFKETDQISISSLDDAWEEKEPHPSVWRGVFTLHRHRKVLFSQQIEVHTTKLSRWKPHITINRRTLARAEDK